MGGGEAEKGDKVEAGGGGEGCYKTKLKLKKTS